MSEFTDAMPDVTGGDLRDILTTTRINAIQGAIKALEGGPAGGGRGRSATIAHRGPMRAGDGGRFIVTHNVSNDRLYVREGWVAAAGTDPFEPKLDGKVLSENPYFDIKSGKSGDYEVVCYYTGTAARVALLKDSDEPDLQGDEEVFYLAKVNIDGKVVPITQYWRSDIVMAATGKPSGPFLGYSSGTTGEGGGKPGVAIAPGSIVLDVMTGDEITTVSGLDTPIAIVPDLVVWLEVAVTDLVATELAVGHGVAYPDPYITFTGTGMDVQVNVKVLVGAVFSGALPARAKGFNCSAISVDEETEEETSTPSHFLQLLHTNLFMALMAVDGKAAVFPLAFAG